MRYVMAVALLSCLPATGSAQGLVTFTVGYRGPGEHDGPIFGIVVAPIRWGWGGLGVELSHAPRIAQKDSGASSPAGLRCRGPDGVFTTCASFRRLRGEATSQLGLNARFGSRSPRVRPFAELGLGYYRTSDLDQADIWDPNGRHLSNLSYKQSDTEGGVYARAGLGAQMKPWSRGPTLALSARYRWAKRGSGSYSWFEWFNDRSGAELVLAVRF